MKSSKNGIDCELKWLVQATFNDSQPGKIIESFSVYAPNKQKAIAAAREKAVSCYSYVKHFSVEYCKCVSPANEQLRETILNLRQSEDSKWAIVKLEDDEASFYDDVCYDTEEVADEACKSLNDDMIDAGKIDSCYFIVVPVKVSKRVIQLADM